MSECFMNLRAKNDVLFVIFWLNMNVIFNAIDDFSEKYFCGCTLTTYGYVTGSLGAVSVFFYIHTDPPYQSNI